jgi:sulfide:quinone oxidoreductase
MPKITYITPSFAVAGQLGEQDFAQLAAMGIKSVINNRPDGEDGVLVAADKAAEAAEHAGLNYRYVPVTNHEVLETAVVDVFEDALRALPGPTLAYCKTGNRSSILWAQVTARNNSTENTLRALSAAGFDLDFLRPEFERISRDEGSQGKDSHLSHEPV